jgi:hypothetical protein
LNHPFFAGLDFKKLIRKEIIPEWKPDVKSETDTNNFDTEFTTMRIYFYIEPNFSVVEKSSKE